MRTLLTIFMCLIISSCCAYPTRLRHQYSYAVYDHQTEKPINGAHILIQSFKVAVLLSHYDPRPGVPVTTEELNSDQFGKFSTTSSWTVLSQCLWPDAGSTTMSCVTISKPGYLPFDSCSTDDLLPNQERRIIDEQDLVTFRQKARRIANAAEFHPAFIFLLKPGIPSDGTSHNNK